MLAKLRNKFRILVIGPGRGGTSLVASLLGAHPKLSIGLEEFAFDFLLGKSLSADEDTLESRVEGFLKACRQKAAHANARWGNKITTEQLEALMETASREEVNKAVLKDIIGKRKVIFIVRDGRSTVHSKMMRTNMEYHEAVKRYKNSVEWLKLFKAKAPNFYIIRFEELLLRPEEQLRALCQYLELKFDETMLQGTANKALLEDYQQKSINREKAGIPPSALAYTEDLREQLEYLGYI